MSQDNVEIVREAFRALERTRHGPGVDHARRQGRAIPRLPDEGGGPSKPQGCGSR